MLTVRVGVVGGEQGIYLLDQLQGRVGCGGGEERGRIEKRGRGVERVQAVKKKGRKRIEKRGTRVIKEGKGRGVTGELTQRI